MQNLLPVLRSQCHWIQPAGLNAADNFPVRSIWNYSLIRTDMSKASLRACASPSLRRKPTEQLPWHKSHKQLDCSRTTMSIPANQPITTTLVNALCDKTSHLVYRNVERLFSRHLSNAFFPGDLTRADARSQAASTFPRLQKGRVKRTQNQKIFDSLHFLQLENSYCPPGRKVSHATQLYSIECVANKSFNSVNIL